MPKGVYERKAHSRITKDDVKNFVRFCFREDIAQQLEKARKPHMLAVSLYENETGIKISTQTAYQQKGKWTKVGDDIVKIGERKPRSSNNRITKAELEDFVRFCFRDDMAELIGNDIHSYAKAADLYTRHTGKSFSPITARNQKGRWIMEGNKVTRI